MKGGLFISCYHPFIGVPIGKTDSGKIKYSLRSLDLSANSLVEVKQDGAVVIPCGRCLGCRLDRSRMWADRMMLELESMKKGCFVTLTYDNDHAHVVFDDDDVPIWYTLKVEDSQKFMKDLRGLKRFEGITIRFFMCGEYGENSFRPHMHFCLFGIGLEDLGRLEKVGKNELGQIYYSSDVLQSVWENGFVQVSEISWETCAYVARYCTKKLSDRNDIDFEALGIQPEFSLMSRRPGIGRKYLDEHPDCLDLTCVNVSTKNGGKKIYLPKYFLKTLDDECYNELMEKRKRFSQDAMLLKLQKAGTGFSEVLDAEEHSLIERVKVLDRKKL